MLQLYSKVQAIIRNRVLKIVFLIIILNNQLDIIFSYYYDDSEGQNATLGMLNKPKIRGF